MSQMKFNKELYSKVALQKATYNFTDIAYIHLDTDESYYYVNIESKDGSVTVFEKDFMNEMLTQSVRHEVYLQTKNVRELLLARALATSIVADREAEGLLTDETESFSEDEILKDWFASNERVED